MKGLAKVLVLTVFSLVVGGPALADQAAKGKIQGDSYYFSIGQMYDMHAFQHASILSKYAASGEAVPSDVLKEHVAAIRSNIAAAEKAFSKISDSTKKNAVSAKKLAEVEQFNAKIMALCAKLEASAKANAAADIVGMHTAAIRQHLTSAYSSLDDAADSSNLFTEEWDQPGHGPFSD